MPKGIPNKPKSTTESITQIEGGNYAARRDILDLNSSRVDIRQESRIVRLEDRNNEEITLADGKKFIRQVRTTVRNDSPNLDFPKKAGFFRYGFSEAKPGSIQRAVDLGFVPATDEDGRKTLPRHGGYKDGQSYKIHLMEIPEELHAKLERIKTEQVSSQNQRVINDHAGQDLGNNSMTYVARDEMKFVTKQS